eukprot:TRINITY_DN42732_c0_g1_i1.p1 TRINITY_DN42732_c0_g1~~TRINITY_DN42732_c0_g1_i1.p1  ORF type:complete len:394 (-),score=70.64 TRINITY_DN42732_c0_g1_i1:42-1223(-)
MAGKFAIFASVLVGGALGVGLNGRLRTRSGTLSSSGSSIAGIDYFSPTFVAPQLTPTQFLMISSSSEAKIVYTELRNFKSTTGRTFALVDSGLKDPRGLAFDGDRGALYVADKGAKSIYRYHVYVDNDGSSLSLGTDGVQLCIMVNADTEWVNVDVNGDVFYTDATLKTINRIPVAVIEMLAKGQYSAESLSLMSQKEIVSKGLTADASGQARQVFSVYQGSNPHVSIPAGVVSDGARLYWVNSVNGKEVGVVSVGFINPSVPKNVSSAKGVTTAFPSKALTNATETGYGIAKSNKLIFYSTDNIGGGSVYAVTAEGNSFNLASGLAKPRGLTWDGDQTIFVADEAASSVYSFPAGRLMENAPLTKGAVIKGAYGVALFGEHQKAWTYHPFKK